MKSFFVNHPAFSLTCLFIVGSIYGLVYELSLYNNFGVNIITLSKPEDFIFGWLRNIYSVSAFLIMLFILIISMSILNILSDYIDTIKKASRFKYFGFAIFLIVFITVKTVSRAPFSKYYVEPTLQSISLIAFILLITLISIIMVAVSNHKLLIYKNNNSFGLLKYIFSKKTIATFLLAGSVFATISDVNSYSQYTYNKILTGKGEQYIIALKSTENNLNKKCKYYLIGVTSLYHIFFSTSKKSRVLIVPNDNISTLLKITSGNNSAINKKT